MATVNRLHTTKKVERPIKVGGIFNQFKQWAVLKHMITAETTRMNHLRDAIASYVEANGEVDDKGSFFLDLEQPCTVGDQVFEQIKRERRVSQFFKEDDAEAWLVKNNLLAEATTTTTFLDQDKVYVLNQEGKIPDAVLDSFFGERVSYAFKPIAN